MVVSVHFYGLQRKLTRTPKIQVPLMDESRVNDIFCYLEEHYPELRISRDDFLVSVNDRISRADQVLNADDIVAFIPHIGGG